MRRSARLTGAVGLTAAVTVVTALSGCAQPEYRYVGSDDHAVVLRVPHSWSPVNTKEALKATGSDPETWTGWTVFYDGSPKPDVAHLKTPSATDPQLYAQSIAVGEEQRAELTDEQMLELMLPGTPQLRAAAEKTKDFAMISKQTIATRKQRGVHVRYSYTIGTTTELYDRIALTDPKRTALHVVFVHCTAQCFREHPEIGDVVGSLTLKSR